MQPPDRRWRSVGSGRHVTWPFFSARSSTRSTAKGAFRSRRLIARCLRQLQRHRRAVLLPFKHRPRGLRPRPGSTSSTACWTRMDRSMPTSVTICRLTLFGDLSNLAFDGEGRIVLPGELIAHAGHRRARRPSSAAAAPSRSGNRRCAAMRDQAEARAVARHEAAARCCAALHGEGGMSARPHVPVLLARSLEALAPRDGGIYVDGTFGAGGYIARHPGRRRLPGVGHRPRSRRHRRGRSRCRRRYRRPADAGRRAASATWPTLLAARGVDAGRRRRARPRRLLDAARRGRARLLVPRDGPLDMRMERRRRRAPPISSTSWPRRSSPTSSSSYGEERHARRVARAIVAGAPKAPITTHRRARRARRAGVSAGRARRHRSGDPHLPGAAHRGERRARRARARAGRGAEALLRPGGRLAVVSFHSLEDRRSSRRFLRARSAARAAPSRHLPEPGRRDAAELPRCAGDGPIRRRGRDRSQPARPLGPPARRRAHRRSGVGVPQSAGGRADERRRPALALALVLRSSSAVGLFQFKYASRSTSRSSRPARQIQHERDAIQRAARRMGHLQRARVASPIWPRRRSRSGAAVARRRQIVRFDRLPAAARAPSGDELPAARWIAATSALLTRSAASA